MDTLIDIISSLGFPVVACIVLFWYIQKKDEQHQNEVEPLRKALEQNTAAIIKLAEKIGD